MRHMLWHIIHMYTCIYITSHISDSICYIESHSQQIYTLQETNISPKNGILKMIFLFPRWDMLIPWRVVKTYILIFWCQAPRLSRAMWGAFVCSYAMVLIEAKLLHAVAAHWTWHVSWVSMARREVDQDSNKPSILTSPRRFPHLDDFKSLQ